MVNLMKNAVVLFGVIFFLASCGSGDTPTFDSIIKSEEGHFRGIEIGASLDEVKKSESVKPQDEEEDYLYYDIELGADDSYAISYSFDEKGLYEIQVDVFFEQPQSAVDLFSKFRTYFGEKYGSSKEEDDGYATWLTTSSVSDEIEISLIDESAGYDYGKISITFYDLDY